MSKMGHNIICPNGHNMLRTLTFQDDRITCSSCLRGEDRPRHRYAVLIKRLANGKPALGKSGPYTGERKPGVYNLPDRNVLVVANKMASAMRAARAHKSLMEMNCA
jgi:hypothetical protein